MMNEHQFAALAGKINDPDDGGFSADLRKGGSPPKDRYMVGQRDVAEGIHPLPAEGGVISDYADSNASTLSRSDRYLGGWRSDGKAYLDVPKGFPRTPQGEVDARKSTLANDQQAYGVMNTKGKYAGEVLNPHDPDHQYEVQAQDSDAATWAEMPLHTASFPKPGPKIPKRQRPQSFS